MGPKEVTRHPIPRKEDLDNLVASLEVSVVALTECLVGPGSRLSFPAAEPAGIFRHLFANLQGLLIFCVGILLEAELLVAAGNVRQRAGRLQLGLDPKFLVGRDGTIRHVELNEDTLAKVLAAEMGKSAARP